MALMRNDPWTLFEQLRREMERVSGQGTEENVTASDWVPAVDVREEGDCFVITADVPGVEPGSIEVHTENGMLVIKGERDVHKQEQRDSYKRIERAYGSFFRRFTLPDTADIENIAAKSQNGVLEIRVPKHEKLQPRKISVQTH
jgi:HSP20 family protein